LKKPKITVKPSAKPSVKQIVYTCLTAACVAVIFMFSAQDSETSSETSRTVLTEITEFISETFDIAVSYDQVEGAQNIFRKFAHFAEYTLLGIFACNMFREIRAIERKRRAAVAAVIFGLAVAVSDEIHQIFVPGRAARVTDVLIDVCGVCVGAGFVWVVGVVVKSVGRRKDSSEDNRTEGRKKNNVQR